MAQMAQLFVVFSLVFVAVPLSWQRWHTCSLVLVLVFHGTDFLAPAAPFPAMLGNERIDQTLPKHARFQSKRSHGRETNGQAMLRPLSSEHGQKGGIS